MRRGARRAIERLVFPWNAGNQGQDGKLEERITGFTQNIDNSIAYPYCGESGVASVTTNEMEQTDNIIENHPSNC